jgi:hypothetical protein
MDYSQEEEYRQKTTGYILTNNSTLEKKTVRDKELAGIPIFSRF